MAEAEGWRVLRIWEHVPPQDAVHLIIRALEGGTGEAEGGTGEE